MNDFPRILIEGPFASTAEVECRMITNPELKGPPYDAEEIAAGDLPSHVVEITGYKDGNGDPVRPKCLVMSVVDGKLAVRALLAEEETT